MSYSRPRLVFAALMYLIIAGGFGVALGDATTTLASNIVIGLIGVFTLLLAIRHAVVACGTAGPILIIRRAGIEFVKPELGLVPWDRIAHVEVWGKMFNRNQFIVRFQPPPLDFPAGGHLHLPVARALFREISGFEIGFYLTDRRPADAAEALSRFWPDYDPGPRRPKRR